MSAEAKNTVLAVLNDLMFQVRILDAAKRAGLQALFAKSRTEALALARQQPALVIVDLNCAAAEPLDLIADLKRDAETHGVPLVGYVSHVQVDLRREAAERGCDLVIARSALVSNLPALLARYTAVG